MYLKSSLKSSVKPMTSYSTSQGAQQWWYGIKCPPIENLLHCPKPCFLSLAMSNISLEKLRKEVSLYTFLRVKWNSVFVWYKTWSSYKDTNLEDISHFFATADSRVLCVYPPNGCLTNVNFRRWWSLANLSTSIPPTWSWSLTGPGALS